MHRYFRKIRKKKEKNHPRRQLLRAPAAGARAAGSVPKSRIAQIIHENRFPSQRNLQADPWPELRPLRGGAPVLGLAVHVRPRQLLVAGRGSLLLLSHSGFPIEERSRTE